MSKDDLVTLLRFITASDLAPDAIVVNFEEEILRAPSVRTCGNILNLSESYSCYNELAEEREFHSSVHMKPIISKLRYLQNILVLILILLVNSYSHYFMGFLCVYFV